MPLNATGNGPHIAHPPVCLKKLLLIVNVTPLANFNNKRLKMSFEQIDVSISFYFISDLKCNQLSPHLLEY